MERGARSGDSILDSDARDGHGVVVWWRVTSDVDRAVERLQKLRWRNILR